MGTIRNKGICSHCGGTGIRHFTPTGGVPYTEPCALCGADGVTDEISGLDDTLIQQIITTQAAHTAELDYIHQKVRKIWNKLKDGAPEE